MPSKDSETSTKRSGTKSPKSKKSTLVNQTIGTENRDERHKMIASTAYYRTKKRGYDGNGTDAVQAWLETLAEIDNTRDVNGIDYQFLTNKRK